MKVPAAEELQLFTEFKGMIEAEAGKQFGTFEAVKYTSQVVAGINFQIKYNVGDSHIHAKVFKPLPHTGAPNEFKGAKGPHAPGATLQK